MSIAEIRASLVHYIEEIDDTKLQALYTLLEPEEHLKEDALAEEHWQIVEKRRNAYLNGEVKLKTWDEIKTRILKK